MATWRIGDRVQLHPATDRWMMGDRYGVVTRIIVRRAWGQLPEQVSYYVKLDKSGKVLNFSEANIYGKV